MMEDRLHQRSNRGESPTLDQIEDGGSPQSDRIEYGGYPLSLISQLKRLNISATTIPEEFGNLIFLRELSFQGSGLSGSIPWEIGEIDTLEELRIDGSNLTGKIPDFIGNWTKLTILDLQGTSMKGPIPSSISLLTKLKELIPWCLMKGLPCPEEAKYHSLFINCGGNHITVEGKNYEADLNTKGQSNFAPIGTRWAYSSTGVYMGKEGANSLATNKFDLDVTGADYYKTARLSPESLKYYGLCMRKGSYKVMLHFAEIMFTNDQTFASHGRRIFDVSIQVKYILFIVRIQFQIYSYRRDLRTQGKLVLKDFNIAKEAGGVGIGITKEFNDVWVNGSTLEIHLYWAGKGTTSIPEKGVYGPLISAITVTPNFEVDTGGLSAGAIVGIVVASCAAVALLLVLLWMKGCFGEKDLENKELRALDLQTGYFTLRQIKDATNNFDPANKIGEGGFGPVYKGTLSDGAVIAVKQLSSRSKQGNREFVNEIGMISALQHPNLVKLYGCCIEGNQLLLAYVLQEQGNLLELVDPSLGSKFSEEEALGMLNIALLCTNPSPTLRPSMSSVVSMLEGKVPVQAPIIMQSSDNQDARFKAFEILSQDSQTRVTTFSQENQSQSSISMDGPWKDSSVSLQTTDETREYSSASKLLDKDLYDNGAAEVTEITREEELVWATSVLEERTGTRHGLRQNSRSKSKVLSSHGMRTRNSINMGIEGGQSNNTSLLEIKSGSVEEEVAKTVIIGKALGFDFSEVEDEVLEEITRREEEDIVRFEAISATQNNNKKAAITTDSGSIATPYDFGAGEISPTAPLQPGLVYETDTVDYLNFVCYSGYNISNIKVIATTIPKNFTCPEESSIDLISNINYPSISISGFKESRTVTRTATNVAGDDESSYVISTNAPKGISVKVNPDKLQFSKNGQKLSYQVTFSSTGSSLKEDLFGSITWSNGKYKVRIPFVVSSSTSNKGSDN
ncbi:hypothetical protein LWI29_008671 [Acer saccharum]|uniref:non-specific serine/threonine protein kinase n=1 Tax=Acer saccharum TaxID=4024 RepID=A0AA39T355_ACESA|nr:hypothetical protein LWI29_008671 [Acer saccharum]